MKILVLSMALQFILPQIFAQKQRSVSLYIDLHVNKTIYDRTFSNNSAGFGFGAQAFINTKTKFKPDIEINGDIFGGTKQLFLTLDGKHIYAKDGVSNILVGATYHPSSNYYVEFNLGPTFLNSNTYLGIKPIIGFYFLNQRITTKIS